MRFFSKSNGRLLAAVIPLSVVTVGGTLLAGCGSGNGTSTFTPASQASGGTSGGITGSFAGRSYTASGLSLTGGRTGTLTLQVSSQNAISGVLTLTNPADAVALTGTLNSATGDYQLTGALTRADGDPVSVRGTLPTSPGTTGGSLTLTLGGQTLTVTFSTSSASPTPTPSGATPTPLPTATTNPTPAPTPTPGTGSGTLVDYYNAFASNTNDTFTYKFTSTDTQIPDPNGVSGTTTDQGTIHGGILFGAAFAGQKTTVTLTLPLSGSKTVTRQEELNPKTGAVTGYTYYTEDSSGRTSYGDDSVFNGVVTSSTRYDNGERIPFSFAAGQSYTQSFTVFETQFDFNGKQTGQYSYAEQEKITFVGVESTTVVGGTYSNVAHLRSETSYTLPAAGTLSTDQPTVETTDFYLSKFVGLVQSINHTVTQNVTGRVNDTNEAYTYTDTTDGRDELVSATVGGTNYPPGRSVSRATPVGGTIPKHAFSFPHRR